MMFYITQYYLENPKYLEKKSLLCSLQFLQAFEY